MLGAMTVRLVSFAARPDLVEAAFGIGDPPEAFMQHCDIGYLYNAGLGGAYAQYAMTVLDGDDVVGRAMTVPFALGIPGREALPVGGWDVVIRWAAEDQLSGEAPTAVAALEISLAADQRGRGLSAATLALVKQNCARLGHSDLYCPLRPTEKARYPTVSIGEYVTWVRDDGLPQDPWLRVHVRAGGQVVALADQSMTIVGTLEDWRSWTGLAFDGESDVVVEGGLAPVVVSQARGLGVYIEPNVWVHHKVN